MHKYIHKVQYYETDRMGITHHSNYIRWMEEARLDFMEQIGIGYDKMESMGIISPVVSVNCEFKKTTTFPDKIEISLEIKFYNGVKLVLSYEMLNEITKKKVATGESVHCFLGKEGRPLAMQRAYPEIDEIFRDFHFPVRYSKKDMI